jgi:hypothetical protein
MRGGAALRTIAANLRALVKDAERSGEPIDPDEIGTAGRQIEAQAEMIEQGLAE